MTLNEWLTSIVVKMNKHSNRQIRWSMVGLVKDLVNCTCSTITEANLLPVNITRAVARKRTGCSPAASSEVDLEASWCK